MRLAVATCIAVVGAAGSASAQSAPPAAPPAGRILVGAFTGTDIPSGIASRTGVSFTVEKTTRVENDGSVSSLALRYSRYGLGGGQAIRSFSPTLESRTYFGAGKEQFQGRYYVGGFGLNFSRNTSGNQATHLVLSAGVGLDRGNRILEARWLLGQVDGESGLLLGIGTRLR